MWKQLTFCFFLGLSMAHRRGVDGYAPRLPTSSSRAFETKTALFAVRQPRRNLKKRKGRERKSPSSQLDTTKADPDAIYEVKPLISYKRKEAGEDFWIDPKELEKEKLRQQAVANRKAMEGEMSKEKLMTEIVAPYKQNWIGIMSVVIVILAAIVTNFPEVLENPSISFPDLDAGDPIPMRSTLRQVVSNVAGAVSDQ